jgi:hypothetical protein
VAALVSFLVSKEANMITGAALFSFRFIFICSSSPQDNR